MKKQKKRKIYQAGYTSHYGWHFVGRGLTIEEARENLETIVERAALESVVRTEVSMAKDGYRLANGEELQQRIELCKEISTQGFGYEETFYIETE